MSSPETDLPPALLQQLEAILFRGGEALARDEAFERLAIEQPEHAAAMRAWVRQVLGLGDGRLREPPPELPGYSAIEKLGEGGFGEVWRCEQTVPVQREVAVKLLKLGMDSAAILKRFAREQEAMARMSHDAIARIHDAGLSPRGQPFFVMELVEGAPITDWCEQRRSGLKERLALFVEVCGGVQHAHQKGLVHRDLKPSNVLVTQVGEAAQPKLIDFGIARALESNDGSLQLTESGMMLGTPAYMAPEQARGDLAAIDTRTDVYALGAILFELLTGKQPHGDWLAAQASPWELRQRIVEGNTPRPSATVIGAGKQETTWQRQLRGDLDWIVLKAMAKEPEQRYASAAELAADVERYLRLEPVLAGPPSRSYRLKKFVWRYRLQVGAAVAVLVTAVSGALVSWRWAREAEANSILASRRADENAVLAEQKSELATAEAIARSAAERSADEAASRLLEVQQVASFQADILKNIVASKLGFGLRQKFVEGYRKWWDQRLEPDAMATQPQVVEVALEQVDATSIAIDLLDGGILGSWLQKLDSEFAAQPVVRARLLQAAGDLCLELGLWPRAQSVIETALGLRLRAGDSEGVRESRVALVKVQVHRGDFVAAEAAIRGLLAESEGLHSADEGATITTATLRNQLATVFLQTGRPAQALELLQPFLGERAAVAKDASKPIQQRLESLMDVMACGQALRRLGRLPEAEPLYRQALLLAEGVDGASDSVKLLAMANLGSLLGVMGHGAAASDLLRRSYEGRRRLLGDDHLDTLISANNLAVDCERRGDYEAALRIHDGVLSGKRRSLGELHPSTLTSRSNIVACLYSLGRYVEAEPLSHQVLKQLVQVRGPNHPSSISAGLLRGKVLIALGRSKEGAAELVQMLERATVCTADVRFQVLSASVLLGEIDLARGDVSACSARMDAVIARLEGVEIVEREFKREAIRAWILKARSAEADGDVASAIEWLRKALGRATDSRHYAMAAEHLSRILVGQRRHAEAVAVLDESISRQSDSADAVSAAMVVARYSRGFALAQLERLDEARDDLMLAASHVSSTHGERDELRMLILEQLGGVLVAKGELETGVRMLGEALDLAESREGVASPMVAGLVAQIARGRSDLGQRDDAAGFARLWFGRMREAKARTKWAADCAELVMHFSAASGDCDALANDVGAYRAWLADLPPDQERQARLVEVVNRELAVAESVSVDAARHVGRLRVEWAEWLQRPR